jgi:hypothetical protein
MDISTTQVIYTLAQQNLKLNEENNQLKLEIAKLKEAETFKKGTVCCGKTSKGTNCPIIPETKINGYSYCWAHERKLLREALCN